MDRRQFFTGIKTKRKNILLDPNIEINYSLDQYKGSWSYEEAAHLLRRSLFGFSDEKIEESINLGLESSVSSLLNDEEPMPEPPVKFYDNQNIDDGLEIGETFIDKQINFQAEPFRAAAVFSWWAENIRNQSFSLREKMTLFWHNHFATQVDVVRIGRFQYQTNQLFRDHALGNFKDLATKVTFDPTMMLFLNGNENIAGRPNENYARELFELFTIGKGEQIGEGNYTTFTELDVREAAKVLTGWNFDFRRQDTTNFDVSFRSFIHDYSTKKFSSAFSGKVIQPTGEGEYYELMNMIFDQEETSKYIIRKLYKWFVYYLINDEVEKNIIEPLSKIFRDNNFEIKPVLQVLLNSEHFFDIGFRGAMIKNPVDFMGNITQSANIDFESLSVPNFDPITLKYYNYIVNYVEKCQEYGMELGNPPSVAGWEAYYQTPGFYRIWISSVTLPLRAEFANRVFSQQGVRGQLPLFAKGLDVVGRYEDAGYPVLLINFLCKKLLSIEIDNETKDRLKLYLVQEGQGDYVWTEAWEEYKANPNNQVAKAGVERKLNSLVIAITNLSEYQLM